MWSCQLPTALINNAMSSPSPLQNSTWLFQPTRCVLLSVYTFTQWLYFEVPGSIPRPEAFLGGVCMSFLCLSGLHWLQLQHSQFSAAFGDFQQLSCCFDTVALALLLALACLSLFLFLPLTPCDRGVRCRANVESDPCPVRWRWSFSKTISAGKKNMWTLIRRASAYCFGSGIYKPTRLICRTHLFILLQLSCFPSPFIARVFTAKPDQSYHFPLEATFCSDNSYHVKSTVSRMLSNRGIHIFSYCIFVFSSQVAK